MSPVSQPEHRPDILLVDFDGTIADTLGYLRQIYARFVREHGGMPSEEEFQSLNGPPIAEVVRILCETLAIALPVEDRVRYYNQLIDENFASAPVMEGTQALFAAARRRGMASWIVTSNARDRVNRWLAANRLESDCQVIVAGEDAAEGKPSPAPYLLALSKLGKMAAHAVAVEDSSSGARSALEAGLVTIKLAPPIEIVHSGLHIVESLHQAAQLLERGLPG